MGLLKVVFQSVFTEELTHTVVSSAHTVNVCVMRRRRGAALVNTGLLKLFSSRIHNGCSAHTLVMCVVLSGHFTTGD